jgi:hypothetical protein
MSLNQQACRTTWRSCWDCVLAGSQVCVTKLMWGSCVLANVLTATVCCLAMVLSCRGHGLACGSCAREKLHRPGRWAVRSLLREVHFSACEPVQPWAGWSTDSAYWEPTKVSILFPTLCSVLVLHHYHTSACLMECRMCDWWWQHRICWCLIFWVCVELGLKYFYYRE